MVWRIRDHKTRCKTDKDRLIMVHEHIAPLVRKRLEHTQPGKPVFPSPRGLQWNMKSMAATFQRLVAKVEKQHGKDCLRNDPEKEDKNPCWYSCRHTFAQRMIAGAMPWQSGRGLALERLCKVMGNSIKVCWRHYADWVDTKLTWLALNGS
jgi:integrase